MTPITVYSPPVETLRKPSTGLKHPLPPVDHLDGRRDTQKTQHGIETWSCSENGTYRQVETLRKPSTGLKLSESEVQTAAQDGRDTQKTQHGIETPGSRPSMHGRGIVETLRKPSTGLKLVVLGELWHLVGRSRHSENPARD